MKALVYDQNVMFSDDYPSPRRVDGESLVAVSIAGICATDLQIVKGYMGFRGVPGHEFVGRVEESDTEELIGKRVVGEINCPCGRCEMCRRGLGGHCASRSVLGIQGRDGAFAEYLTLPDENLHIVPANVSDREAVFTEPVAAACRALDQAELSGEENVFVLGDGRLGLLIAKVFAASGVTITLFGKHRDKLAIAGASGIRTGISDETVEERIADVVIDATGDPSGLERALKVVRPTGRVILKTTVASPYRINLSPLVVDEISIIGSRCGPFDKALELLSGKRIEVSSMISAEFPLERGLDAFGKAKGNSTLKVLIAMGGDSGSEL